MFKRFPYWGWLMLSMLLWCSSIYYFRAHREEVLPEQMARIVNEDLNARDRAFNSFIQQQDLVRRMFADSLTAGEVKRISELPFYVYIYDGDSLKFWNNNSVIGLNNDSLQGNSSIRRNQKGVFIRKYLRQTNLEGNKKVVALLPLLITYPMENDYLHAHFVASDNIPVKTKISSTPAHAPDEYRITLRGNETVGYLTFNREDIQKWTPDIWLIGMLIAAVIFSIAWLQLITLHITRKKHFIVAPLIILAITIAIRILLYSFGVPFHLNTLTIFSPTLYGSSWLLASLGDLFISILLVLWVVVFITRHTNFRTYFSKVSNPVIKAITAILLSLVLVAYVLFFIKIIRSLVLDSRISFDVTHFYSVTPYTVLGLLAIISIMGISCMVVYLFNVQFRTLISNRWLKLLLVAAAFVVYYIMLKRTGDVFAWYVFASVLLFVYLLDFKKFALSSKLFEPYMIIWALIICSYSTAIVHYYNEVKEKVTRIAFVEQRLSPHHDDQLELSFDKTARLIEHDKQLKNFFYKPAAAMRKNINQHLDSLYFSGLSRYQTMIYLYDDEQKPLFNKDTTSYPKLIDEKYESVITNSAYLFYKESILNRHYYLSYIPIYNDTVNNIIGYVFIGLDQKKATTETVYPELLQPVTNKSTTGDYDYAYAMYIGGKLITHTNDYAFPVRLKYDTLKEQEYVYETKNGYSTLYSKIADKRTAVVVHYHSELIETITLFSYLFGIQVCIALLIFAYQLYLSFLSGRLFKATGKRLALKGRIHLSMLSVVLISFVIIGWVTIQFFTSEYRKSNANKLQVALQVAKQSVQDYLAKEQAFNAEQIFDTVSKSPAFKSFITTVANNQKVDINIFDDWGNLLSSSQDEIYDKGLISRKIRPDAYYYLDHAGQSLVIQNEKVAGLSYTSAYQPLRNEQGVTLGYINVPFFSSEKDLDYQISNIVVTLLNLYAVIFLISSVVTLIVTRWVTRIFDILIGQFDKINLEQNERIEWHHNDEIGKLVREYNKMVKKVEENAARLAQSERETAWREMARQVAHEIKNPLTPMKLNIQYLQQAMRNDNPNIKQLTERVSVSIIEQIDNLSYIASEFSNFAKMPEAKPEELDPGKLLTKAVELYTKDDVVSVSIEQPNEPLLVLCDHSQLLRVFTNLLENAKQAIPPDRHGQINVSISKRGNEIFIAIADNGSGIDEEVSKRIFQPYFTTKSSGTGLGLAMTKKIIEFWKGEIWFETEENEGTTFYIRLPLIESEA